MECEREGGAGGDRASGGQGAVGKAAAAAKAAAGRAKKKMGEAYNKAADKFMGSLDGDTATRK
jgi:hypothetical protein